MNELVDVLGLPEMWSLARQEVGVLQIPPSLTQQLFPTMSPTSTFVAVANMTSTATMNQQAYELYRRSRYTLPSGPYDATGVD